MMDSNTIGVLVLSAVIYIIDGGFAWAIMDDLDFDGDAAILCAVGWPVTLIFWGCFGFVYIILLIPKAVFRILVRLGKRALKRRSKHKRTTTAGVVK